MSRSIRREAASQSLMPPDHDPGARHDEAPVTDRFPSSRDEAPAYLVRYLQRRREPASAVGDPSAPPYLARARARAQERARAEQAGGTAPPDRSEAFARVTTSPRELQVPDAMRSRLVGSTDARLIRHGQTQGYTADGALTPLGRWQSHRKGQDLARGVGTGSTVRILHAPTARAEETAVGLHEGLLQGLARFGIDGAIIEDPKPDEAFRNFQVWCDGKEQDPTAAFQHFASVLEGYERTASGDRPGWLVEMDRFWNVEAAGGDPITYWLNQPMQYFEPAALVVRRFWRGIIDAVGEGPEQLRILVCSHSGPIRALATHAVGHDPGEPYNLEDVRIRVLRDLEHAIVTYRGRGLEIEIPTTVTPSWYR
jgi:broad specificity phosphatase PhoE